MEKNVAAENDCNLGGICTRTVESQKIPQWQQRRANLKWQPSAPYGTVNKKQERNWEIQTYSCSYSLYSCSNYFDSSTKKKKFIYTQVTSSSTSRDWWWFQCRSCARWHQLWKYWKYKRSVEVQPNFKVMQLHFQLKTSLNQHFR